MVLAGNTMSEDEEIRDNLVRLKNWKKHKLTALEKEREDLEKIKNDSVCTIVTIVKNHDLQGL